MLSVADSLNGLKQLVSLYNNDNIQITDKTSSLDEKALNEYKKFAQKSYNDILKSSTFKPNSREEFKLKLNIEMSISSGVMTGKDFIQKQGACQDLLSSLDLDSEFNKFLESKGCANEQELQALNKTIFKTTQELKTFSEARLNGVLSYVYDSPTSMSYANKIINGSSVSSLVNFYNSTTNSNWLETSKAAKILISDYQGNELNADDLILMNKKINTLIEALDKQEKEAQKHRKPLEQLGQTDYSKFDKKYGEKYEQALIRNYKE